MRPAVVNRSGAVSISALSAVTRSLYRAVLGPFRCGNPTGFDAVRLPKRQARFTCATLVTSPRLRTVGRVTVSSRASAWVESPLQLVCAVEYAALAGIPLRIVPRAGAAQLTATAERLRDLRLPSGVEIVSPRTLPPTGAAHLVVGDAYSGVVHASIAMRMPQRVTIVDDGSASLGLPSALDGARALSRDGAGSAIASLASSRIRALDAAGDLELFSYYRLDHPALIPNRFSWLSSRGATGLAGGDIVLGSAAVVDSLLSERSFIDWLAEQPTGARYLPHRREARGTIAAAALLGLDVVEQGLPVELVLLGSRDLAISTLPSSAAETLRILLAGSGSSISVDARLAMAA